MVQEVVVVVPNQLKHRQSEDPVQKQAYGQSPEYLFQKV